MAISLTTLGTAYAQDFDTLPASGSATWTNDLTLVAGYHARTGTGAVRQLVFIDRQVPDLARLTAGLEAGTCAYLLDAGRDALAQIADGLARHGAVAAVHIVAHGSPGALHFASGTVSHASLTDAAVALARIGAALAPE